LIRSLKKSVFEVASNFSKFSQQNRSKTFRAKIFALLNSTPESNGINRYIDSLVILTVLVSVVCIILETVQDINNSWTREFHILDLMTIFIFSIEYVARVYSCCELEYYRSPIKGRIKYMLSASALVDLLAIFPFYYALFNNKTLDLRFLRIFRLTRLLKLTRYTCTLNTLIKAVQREQYVLYAAAFMMILMIILTASLGYLFEHEAQPDKFESIPTSMYWAVITLASVGYGDITPITPLGRMMTVVVSFVGIGIFAIPAGLMASSFTDQLRLDRKTFEDEVRKLASQHELTPDQLATLEIEAQRLHLSRDVFQEIINRVDIDNSACLHTQTQTPTNTQSCELTLEEYRKQVSLWRTIALGPQSKDLDALMLNESKTTALERSIWKSLNDSK